MSISHEQTRSDFGPNMIPLITLFSQLSATGGDSASLHGFTSSDLIEDTFFHNSIALKLCLQMKSNPIFYG